MLSAELTVMRSSLVLTLTLLRFQDTVGSGWPRGGTHSKTAGSPAATTTSFGACRKSSLRTRRRKKRNLISVRSPVCLVYFKQRLEIRRIDHWAAAQMTALIRRNLSWILFCFLVVNHISLPCVAWKQVNYCVCMCMAAQIPGNVLRLPSLLMFSRDHVLLCCLSCQRWIMHISHSNMEWTNNIAFII